MIDIILLFGLPFLYLALLFGGLFFLVRYLGVLLDEKIEYFINEIDERLNK